MYYVCYTYYILNDSLNIAFFSYIHLLTKVKTQWGVVCLNSDFNRIKIYISYYDSVSYISLNYEGPMMWDIFPLAAVQASFSRGLSYEQLQ